MPSGAPTKKKSSGPPPQRHLTIWFWPPIALAEPCSTLAVVVPPASSRYTETSKGFITSWIRTSAVTLCVPSLTSPSTAVCECASMIPGVTCLPRPSTSMAPDGRLQVLSDGGDLSVHHEQVGLLEDPGAALRPDRGAPHDDGRGRGHRPRLARRQRANVLRGRRRGRRALLRHGRLVLLLFLQLDPRPVDPDFGHAALLREGRAGLDDEVGDLSRRDRAEAVLQAELLRRDRGDRRQRVVLRQSARHRLADALAEVLRVVEPGRREREREPGVAEPLRVGRRAVDGPQLRDRNVEPLLLGRGLVGLRKGDAQHEVRLDAGHLGHEAVLVAGADVARLQLHLLRDLRRAQEREHVGRLEDDDLLALRRRNERRRRGAVARARPARRARVVRGLGLAPPVRVEEGLPRHRDGAHLRHRIRPVVIVRGIGLERDVLAARRLEDAPGDRAVGEADDRAAAAQDSRARRGVDDRETHPAVRVGDVVLHDERVDRAVLRADGRDRVAGRPGDPLRRAGGRAAARRRRAAASAPCRRAGRSGRADR